jgi:hypothetical protein
VTVSEVVISRECARPGCGRSFTPARRGPAQRYCCPSCRQRAYALRQARGEIDAGTAEPLQVLRETVCEVLPPDPSAREWLHLLGQLAEQLDDESTAVAREHWQHPKLLAALQRAASALDAAHPGGLGRVKR